MIVIGLEAVLESVVSLIVAVAQSQGPSQRRACLGVARLLRARPLAPVGMEAVEALRSLAQVLVPQDLPHKLVQSLLGELTNPRLSV